MINYIVWQAIPDGRRDIIDFELHSISTISANIN